MTTIAYDGEMIAADSQASGDHIRMVKKIYHWEGSFFGCCGYHQQALAFKEWISSGKDKPTRGDMDEFHSLFINTKGKCLRYDSMLIPYEADPPFAIGSGCDFAMGAMLAGKTAEEAVEIAKKLDPYTGGDVQVVILPKT